MLAVRADFYGRCAAYPALSQLLGANHVLVGPMRRDELRRAIELPARRVGLEVEPELVDALVDRRRGRARRRSRCCPPRCSSCGSDRDGRRLRHATYERTGGVRGAVARLAEEAYGGLDARPAGGRAQRSCCGWPTRARAARSCAGASRSPSSRARVARTSPRVLAVLTERRLLTMSADARSRSRTRRCCASGRACAAGSRRTPRAGALQRRLTDAAREWDERGRDAGELYRGARLAVALEWRDGHEHELNATERAFLDAGRTAAGRAQRRLRLALAGVAALLAARRHRCASSRCTSAARPAPRRASPTRSGSALQALTEGDLDRSLLLARQGVRARRLAHHPCQPPRRPPAQPCGHRGRARRGDRAECHRPRA